MKKVLLSALLAMTLFALTACGTEALQEEAQTAVDAYNAAVEALDEKAAAYNAAASEVSAANQNLQAAIDAAQDAINKGEDPYDPATLDALKDAMSSASQSKVQDPEPVASFEKMAVDSEADRETLTKLIEEATTGVEEVEATEVPEVPEIPDFSSTIQSLGDAQKTYENSIQSLKQITAPTDDFVKERLQRIDTITEMDAVTEEHDPNGMLNKQGGYIGCIYFTDSQVDRSQVYIEDGKDNVIDVGTEGGGAIEIFATPEEANTRNDYLASFDGSMLSSGSHYVEGTCLIRTSDLLNGTQQKELTQKITDALIAID